MISKAFPIFIFTSLFTVAGCATPAGPSDEVVTSTVQEPSPFQEQWPLDFTRDQLNDAAMLVAHRFFEQNSSDPATQANYFFEDSVSEVRRGWEKDLSSFTLGVFSDYAYKELNLVGGMSQEFMRDTLTNNDIEYPDGSDVSVCGISMPEDDPSGCNYSNTVWFGYGELPEQKSQAFRHAAAHEIYHTVQSATAGGHEAFYGMPQWFIEGSADFIGYGIADYLDYYSYESQAEEQWHYLPNPDAGLEFWSQAFGGRIPPEHYLLGQVAAQYIAVNVGIEGLLGVTINMGNGMIFPEAFEESVGMSLTKFYALFDIAYAKMMEKDTGSWRTYENRLCPEEYGWDCTIDNYSGIEWWQLLPVSIQLPDEAENLNHDRETHIHYIDFDLENCDRMINEMGAVAASSEYATSPSMIVSTQWYARQAHLDANLDGIACGPGDPM